MFGVRKRARIKYDRRILTEASMRDECITYQSRIQATAACSVNLEAACCRCRCSQLLSYDNYACLGPPATWQPKASHLL